jgi:hypothetical protein
MRNGVPRTNLSRFLANRWNPEPELTLALQGGRFGIKPPHSCHVAVKPSYFEFGKVCDDFAVFGVFRWHAISAIWC